ncbi:MAG: hypothetical protein MZW92_43340 [Comamonadaceae bacterium]|nr:hypothetical protein [Comamonadaceae bacterium]
MADTLLHGDAGRTSRSRAPSTGWKGFINDPLHGRLLPHRGGHRRRRASFLIDVARARACPPATEALDPIAPQYLGDLDHLVRAIGARTSESQTHREMACGLSTPVGFKNGTDGDARRGDQRHPSRPPSPHSFLGINSQGRTAIVRTRGNALRPPRAARRRRAAQLRHGAASRSPSSALAKAQAAAEHRRRLLARQLARRTRRCSRWC